MGVDQPLTIFFASFLKDIMFLGGVISDLYSALNISQASSNKWLCKSARNVIIDCPPFIRQHIPESFNLWLTNVLQVASTIPEPNSLAQFIVVFSWGSFSQAPSFFDSLSKLFLEDCITPNSLNSFSHS
jgi:hypothetical protein